MKKKGRRLSLPVQLLFAQAIGVLVILAGAIALSLMVLEGVVEKGGVGYGAVVVLLSASAISAAVSMGAKDIPGYALAGISAIIQIIVLCIWGAIQFDLSPGKLRVTAGLILAGAGAAFLVLKTGTKGKRRCRLKKSYR